MTGTDGCARENLSSQITRCASCGDRVRRDRNNKYCSAECAPFGHFLNGARKKGPIEYFSRARLEIERLEEENAKLRAQLEGRPYKPEPDLSTHPKIAVARAGTTVWVAKRPRFHKVKPDTRTLEERAAELRQELAALIKARK